MPPGGGRLGKGGQQEGWDPPRLEANTPTETRAMAPGEPAEVNDKPQREGVGAQGTLGDSAVSCPTGSAQLDLNHVLGRAGVQPAELSQALPGPPAPHSMPTLNPVQPCIPARRPPGS